MSNSLWMRGGKVVRDSVTGQLVLCGACPCTTPPPPPVGTGTHVYPACCLAGEYMPDCLCLTIGESAIAPVVELGKFPSNLCLQITSNGTVVGFIRSMIGCYTTGLATEWGSPLHDGWLFDAPIFGAYQKWKFLLECGAVPDPIFGLPVWRMWYRCASDPVGTARGGDIVGADCVSLADPPCVAINFQIILKASPHAGFPGTSPGTSPCNCGIPVAASHGPDFRTGTFDFNITTVNCFGCLECDSDGTGTGTVCPAGTGTGTGPVRYPWHCSDCPNPGSNCCCSGSPISDVLYFHITPPDPFDCPDLGSIFTIAAHYDHVNKRWRTGLFGASLRLELTLRCSTVGWTMELSCGGPGNITSQATQCFGGGIVENNCTPGSLSLTVFGINIPAGSVGTSPGECGDCFGSFAITVTDV